MSPWRIEGAGIQDPIIGYEGQLYRGVTVEGDSFVAEGTVEGFDVISGDLIHKNMPVEYVEAPGTNRCRAIPLPNGQFFVAYVLTDSTLIK